MRILIVDDIMANCLLMEAILQNYGSATLTTSGREAIAHFERELSEGNPYELITLDISMPGMNGHEVLHSIRMVERMRHLPDEQRATIIMVTALNHREDIVNAAEHADAYILKPIDINLIKSTIEGFGFTNHSLKQKEEPITPEPEEIPFEPEDIDDKNTEHPPEDVTINGDLKLRNLDNAISVEINGDVADNAEITAIEDVTISGIVGSAQITAGGNVNLFHFHGKGTGKLSCKGNFSLEATHNATAECDGNILIERESLGSTLKSCGSIQVATVAGGELIAKNNITATKVGTARGMRTVLSAGTNFHNLDRLKKLELNLELQNSQIQRLDGLLGSNPLSQDYLDSLPEDRKDSIEKMISARQTAIDIDRPKIENDIKKLTSKNNYSSNAKIIITEMIHHGVIIKMGNDTLNINEDIVGPVTITYDKNVEKIVLQ